MTALISVVIATHNRPHLLADTVRSALEQDGPVEIVVVDDGPTRSARPVIEALSDPRVRYLANPQPSTGRPAAVRNFGATQTTGSLLHFLDDDDRVPPGFYAAARAALTDRRRAGLVYGVIEPFGDDPAVIATERAYFHRARRRSRLCRRLGHRWAFVAHMLFNATLLVCSAAIIRRSALGTGFNEALMLGEDVDLHTRIMRETGAVFLDQPTLHYRIGPSLMRQPAVDQLIRQSAAMGHAAYRARWGSAEYLALRIVARGLRWP